MTSPTIDYSARDFDNIRTALIAYINAQRPELWSDFEESNLGSILLDLIAYVGDMVSFYIDRAAEESFLPTARVRDSLIKLCALIGYKPHGLISATVTVKAKTIPTVLITNALVIEANTTFSAGGLTWEAPVEYNFPANPGTVSFLVREGQTYEDTYVGDATDFQLCQTTRNAVEWNSWTVVVDGDTYVQVDSILTSDEDAKEFEAYYDGSFLVVKFGDGDHGKVPGVGAAISVFYRTSQGSLGNLAALNVDGPIIGIAQTGPPSPVTLDMYNVAAATGGEDEESVDEIKKWAPLSVRQMDKCLTKEDYVTEASNFSDPTYGSISRAAVKLRGGTLALPNPGPTTYTVRSNFTTVTDHTVLQSLGRDAGFNNDKVTQSFQLSSGYDLTRLQFYMKKTGDPVDISVRIETNNAGDPSGTLAHANAYGTILNQEVYGTGWVQCLLHGPATLSGTTTYWLVLTSVNTTGNYYDIYGDLHNTYASGIFRFHASGGAWANGTELLDAAFKTETGGPHTVHANDPILIDAQVYKALSEFEIDGKNIAVFLDPNTVDIYAWIRSGDTFAPPSANLRKALVADLVAKSVVTVTPFVHDGQNVTVDVSLGTVYIKTGYDLAIMLTNIEDAVTDFFVSTVILPGMTLRVSDIIGVVENVEGVDYFTMTAPANDVATEWNEIPVLGTLTVTTEFSTEAVDDVTGQY